MLVLGHVEAGAGRVAWVRARVVLAGWLGVAMACAPAIDEAPAGAVARVGRTWLLEDHVQSARAELDVYGRQRFRGDGGRRDLLTSLIEAELLRQRADAAGLGDDARVRWTVIDALAARQLAAELERRVDRAALARDDHAITDYYREHRDEFAVPERRGVRGVFFNTAEAADAAWQRYAKGESLEALGRVFEIRPAARDDHEFPAFHHLLFDPKLGDGDRLPAPIYTQERLMVGHVHHVEPASWRPLDDPAVRDEIVDRLRAPALDRARAQLVAELREADPL